MKKLIAILLLAMQLTLLAGCGQEEKTEGEEVVITVPRDLADDKTDEEIINDSANQGMEAVIDQKNDTVIYHMTREKNNAVLFGLKGQMDESINAYVHSKDPSAIFIKKITYNESMTTFNVVVDKAGYLNRVTDKALMNIFSAGATYQLFSGKKPEKIDVKLRIIAENKKKPFEIRTMMENSANASDADGSHSVNNAD